MLFTPHYRFIMNSLCLQW
uniref:Uncharacterized protein n=1 Tax=Anguilla anguilla TaxID=7936 RepID=A0A0E9Q589_ANGAN